MVKNKRQERRRNKRFFTSLVCVIKTRDGLSFSATIRDMSVKGVNISSFYCNKLQVNEPIEIWLKLYNMSVLLRGMVMWKSGNKAGVEIHEDSPDLKIFRVFVRERFR